MPPTVADVNPDSPHPEEARSAVSKDACSTCRVPSLLLPDLVAGHHLQHFHHAGMIPGGAAMCRRRVEQLLTGGGVGQREMERPCLREREVQILLMQLNAETRLEVALDHPLAVDLENARG